MMNIFKNANSKPNIFGAFAYMDRREDNVRSNRDNDPNFIQTFKIYSEQFAANPSSFLRNKGYHKFKKPFGYGVDYADNYKKPQPQTPQELHEVVFVTSGSKQNKEKKKSKKKKVLKGDSEEYNAAGAGKVEIVESSDEEEKKEGETAQPEKEKGDK